MSLLDHLDKLITERGSAAVLDKHLSFVRAQAESLEKQLAELQQENARLKQQVAHLAAQVEATRQPDDFVECRGALFKRKPGGGYHDAVFCPKCRGPMVAYKRFPFDCAACRTNVNFSSFDLHNVMAELP